MSAEERVAEFSSYNVIADTEEIHGDVEHVTDREYCLEMAKQIVCNDRDKQYGKPENSFPVIAKLWSAYLGVDISPMDTAMLLGLLKVARIKTGKFKEDNYIDLAGYTACAMELGGMKNESTK